jgi:hypothetical protein
MKHTEIESVKQLANYSRCSVEFLENAIKNEFIVIDYHNPSDNNFDKKNRSSVILEKLYIKKKGKASGYRVVYEIKTLQLANTLKILNNYLNEIFTPENTVHGFVPGRSTKSNAKSHLAKETILSVDIENYFESISKEMVVKALTQVGFGVLIAEFISNITTINGHLVQGFNTSPTIANIVTHQMDKELAELSGDEIVYTRYADDLYFSSNDTLPKIKDINNVISSFGFRLNEKKTKEMKRGRNQYVTGLTVFDDKLPRIPKRIKRNLRLEIYYITKFGYKKHAIRRLNNSGLSIYDSREFRFEIEQEIIETSHRLFGWIHYIFGIEPNVGNKLYSKLKDAKNKYKKYYP